MSAPIFIVFYARDQSLFRRFFFQSIHQTSNYPTEIVVDPDCKEDDVGPHGGGGVEVEEPPNDSTSLLGLAIPDDGGGGGSGSSRSSSRRGSVLSSPRPQNLDDLAELRSSLIAAYQETPGILF